MKIPTMRIVGIEWSQPKRAHVLYRRPGCRRNQIMVHEFQMPDWKLRDSAFVDLTELYPPL